MSGSLTPSESASLTWCERRTLFALRDAIEQYGNPSLAEIAECCGRGRDYASNVHVYLRALARKGYVALPPRNQPRSVKLLKF